MGDELFNCPHAGVQSNENSCKFQEILSGHFCFKIWITIPNLLTVLYPQNPKLIDSHQVATPLPLNW